MTREEPQPGAARGAVIKRQVLRALSTMSMREWLMLSTSSADTPKTSCHSRPPQPGGSVASSIEEARLMHETATAEGECWRRRGSLKDSTRRECAAAASWGDADRDRR
eukprot:CAMPEP_0114138712 /NCGR_PEP_ID=MMETSP0043_2-20121206/16471_1 /TAXON_ID=464988 /ORGANISM="Hemiselmis andersenii, Strain CCMP644" /LENGTH=107 /DNA_ID=CAMNT_0001232705 /DNA_START=61 /DNA_END=384 /DNA_ORIENTATION=+